MRIYEIIVVLWSMASVTSALPQGSPASLVAENSSGAAVVGGATATTDPAAGVPSTGLPATTDVPAVAATAVAAPQAAAPQAASSASASVPAAPDAAAVAGQSSSVAPQGGSIPTTPPTAPTAVPSSTNNSTTTYDSPQGLECNNQQTAGASSTASGASSTASGASSMASGASSTASGASSMASGASSGSVAAQPAGDSGATIGNPGAGGPKITLKNPTSSPHSYSISTGADSKPGNFGMEGGHPAPDSVHNIPPNADVIFYPGVGWSGAVTQSINGKDGSRHEFTHDLKTGQMWYDTDQEFGLSNSTLKPVGASDKLPNGQDAESGEKDWSAKINAAWAKWSGDKQALLNNAGCKAYLDGTAQFLTHIAMDKGAPATCQGWVDFLQLQTGAQSYIDKGAVAGQAESETGKAADKMTKIVCHLEFVITSY